MEGQIIYEDEMREAREQAEVLQAVINQHPSLKPSLGKAKELLTRIGYKGMP